MNGENILFLILVLNIISIVLCYLFIRDDIERTDYMLRSVFFGWFFFLLLLFVTIGKILTYIFIPIINLWDKYTPNFNYNKWINNFREKYGI